MDWQVIAMEQNKKLIIGLLKMRLEWKATKKNKHDIIRPIFIYFSFIVIRSILDLCLLHEVTEI